MPPPFVYGGVSSGDYPVVGDWDNVGDDTVGIKNGTSWSLRNSNSAGPADSTITYGLANDLPLAYKAGWPT